MTTFLLIHGAWHGGWCWDRVVPLLTGAGHTCLTPDLPLENGRATFEDYADTAIASLPPSAEDLVLVGHSLGGMVFPLVAERLEQAGRPARAGVFVCGVVPHLGGLPWEDAPTMGEDVYDVDRSPDGTLTWTSLTAATRAFNADCTAADAAWAFSRLRPFNNSSLWDRPYPLEVWPNLSYRAVTGVDDPAITVDYQRATLSARLGVTPVELPGGHSPFLSRPADLADLLQQF